MTALAGLKCRNHRSRTNPIWITKSQLRINAFLICSITICEKASTLQFSREVHKLLFVWRFGFICFMLGVNGGVLMDGWVEDIPAQELLLYRCHALAGVINETTKTPWRQFK